MDNNDYNKLIKLYLEKKLKKNERNLRNMKRKVTIFNILIIIAGLSSISISLILAGTASIIFPPIVITSLTIISGILTSIILSFKINDRKKKLNNLIKEVTEIKNKLDYIISCNIELTAEEYEKIIN